MINGAEFQLSEQLKILKKSINLHCRHNTGDLMIEFHIGLLVIII